jgi:hypothetical protein
MVCCQVAKDANCNNLRLVSSLSLLYLFFFDLESRNTNTGGRDRKTASYATAVGMSTPRRRAHAIFRTAPNPFRLSEQLPVLAKKSF